MINHPHSDLHLGTSQFPEPRFDLCKEYWQMKRFGSHLNQCCYMEKMCFFTDAMWPPTVEQVIIYFANRGMNEREAKDFYDLYQIRGWRNWEGKIITNWKKAAHRWIDTAHKYSS